MNSSDYDLIVVGASWGGLDAIGRLLEGLSSDLGPAVALVQHRASDDVVGLSGLLESRSGRAVRDVEDKDPIEPGQVYLAPPEYHLQVEPGRFSLSTDERVQYARPSIDVLFESAADAYGERVIGVILTGANEDGAAGLARIKERGGVAIVQDPTSAERGAMPAAALAVTAADAVLPLDDIAPFITGLCLTPARSRV
jgi:two-component system, chemotaxis family, protein-glutamate methylesterase/glutaminase